MTETSAELTILVWSVILTFVLILVPATQSVLVNGMKVMTGPRDNLPEPGVVNKRLRRLAANMIENLVLFAPLVLAAAAAGISNQWTVLGCQLFLGARLIHALVYAFGIPWIRPIFWAVAVAGMGMIAWQVLA
ncbi:MAPEG family protein [Emcibacter sp. SYSU 3D8]|uniref:MAPEG family protein n=1 Tax=Emcibacter sp. SYSU 3D8 TaxID=3133969 RepID=UPI0031FE8E2C